MKTHRDGALLPTASGRAADGWGTAFTCAEEVMSALTWTRAHLPHRPVAAEAAPRKRGFRSLVVAVLAAYVLVLAALVIIASTVLTMTAGESWAFAIGVASYILLFSSFIGALVWIATKNLLDDPSRR